MKHCKYLLLMLMAVLTFASCEKDDDEKGLSQYIKITNIRCERVGSVLRIDYTMKNVSGQSLRKIKFGTPVVVDNNGKKNYQQNKLSFNGGTFYSWTTSFSMSKGEEMEGTFVITEFDTTNKAKRVDLTFDATIDDVDFNGEGSYCNLTVNDDRVMSDGIQTNDPGLIYEDATCIYQNGYAYLSFYVTSDTNISDYTLKDWTTGKAEFTDNRGTRYYQNIFVAYNDGTYMQTDATTSLRAGVRKKVTFRIPDFSSRATQITTGYFSVKSSDYPMTDDNVQVFDLPVR